MSAATLEPQEPTGTDRPAAQHDPDGRRVVGATVERLWPGASWTSEPLTDGMTNRNFKVTVTPPAGPQRMVVVQEQLPEPLARGVGISRENQLELWPAMFELGLAPELIAWLTDLGVSVTQFVEGDRLTDAPDRAAGIRLTAQALRQLHDHTVGTDIEGLVSDPFQGVRWLAERVAASSPERLERYDWAMDLLDRLESARGPYERCLAHTDPTQVNIFVLPGGDRVQLIDWEYAGAGDRYMDVAHFAARFGLDSAEEHELLQAYEGRVDERHLAIIRIYRFVGMLREALWSECAVDLEFLEFDHTEYTAECMRDMRATVSSAEFADALDVLERTTGTARADA